MYLYSGVEWKDCRVLYNTPDFLRHFPQRNLRRAVENRPGDVKRTHDITSKRSTSAYRTLTTSLVPWMILRVHTCLRQKVRFGD
jgi:hypothetical protein